MLRRLNELKIELKLIKKEIVAIQNNTFTEIDNNCFVYLTEQPRYKIGLGRFQHLWDKYIKHIIHCRVSTQGINDKFFEIETIRLLFDLFNVQKDNPCLMYKSFYHRHTKRLNDYFENKWNSKNPTYLELDKLIDFQINQLSFV